MAERLILGNVDLYKADGRQLAFKVLVSWDPILDWWQPYTSIFSLWIRRVYDIHIYIYILYISILYFCQKLNFEQWGSKPSSLSLFWVCLRIGCPKTRWIIIMFICFPYSAYSMVICFFYGKVKIHQNPIFRDVQFLWPRHQEEGHRTCRLLDNVLVPARWAKGVSWWLWNGSGYGSGHGSIGFLK